MSPLDVPAVIAGSVDLLRFSEALARAGIVGRHDPARGVLVIEPATPTERRPADALLGMTWWNHLPPADRRYWLDVARSAVPADAWRVFQAGAPGPP